MLKWLTKRNTDARKADELYGAVVAQARKPAFYSLYGVPDTMSGRYELIILHLALVLDRLKGGGVEADTVGRRTLERFVTDMDDCMREIGVGDMTVPKKVKKAAAGFYERAHAYGLLLANNDEETLAEALSDIVYQRDPADPSSPRRLAAYATSVHTSLKAQPVDTLSDVTLAFPEP